MKKYRNVVQDSNGNAIRSATITVTDYPSGTTSTIYSDNSGTSLSNPFTASSVDGAFKFYAPSGRYTTTIDATGYDIEGDEDISLEESITRDTKAEVQAMTFSQYHAGTKVFITSADGGEFTVRYNATPATYADDGGSYCGTQFIPSGGDGTIGIVRDKIEPVLTAWFGSSISATAAANNTAIQAALDYAESLLPVRSTQPDGALGYDYGGAIVEMGEGEFDMTNIEIPYNVIFRGQGRRSTTLVSSYNGQIVRSKYTSGTDPYTNRSGGIENIRIKGSGAGASQVGLDIMRWNDGSFIKNVEVGNCGSHGVIFRELVGTSIESLYSMGNGGDGIVLQSGIDDWTSMTPNSLPCNAATLNNCISALNDGAGLRINDSNGNFVIGGYYQLNYDASGNNIGYNIIIEGNSYNNVLNAWCEGPVQAHVYQNLDGTNTTVGNTLNNMTLIANGATGIVDRAVICNKGTLFINDIIGNAAPFKTINSSQAPLQCNKTNAGRIVYRGRPHTGSSVNGLMIEDENNLDYNLHLYAYQEIINASTKTSYGVNDYYTESDQSHDWFKDTGTGYDANAWFRINPFTRSLDLGDGSATANAQLRQGGAGYFEGFNSSVWERIPHVVSATTAQLADIAHAINTTAKYTGKMVWNTTTTKPVWAAAGTSGALWHDATGATAHTPV